jgi:lipopolysaccharide export system permease protein
MLKRAWWRTSFRIWGYILRAHGGPFFTALSVVMFVFLLQFLMRFIDKLVGKGLDPWTVIQLIGLNLAWMVVMALPMAVLVATLMAFGSLAASNEMTAMRSAGVSFARMIFPVIIIGALVAYLDLRFNNDVLPDANHKAKDLAQDIQRKKPTFSIMPGEFSDENALPGFSIFAKERNTTDGTLTEVIIYDHSNPIQTNTLTAKTANLQFSKDYKNMLLSLHNGEIHQSYQNQQEQYRRGEFTDYDIVIPTSGYDFTRDANSERGDRELSADSLMKYVNNRRSAAEKAQINLTSSLSHFDSSLHAYYPGNKVDTEASVRRSLIKNEIQQTLYGVIDHGSQMNGQLREANSYLVEVHKKYALPVACLVFVLLGAPLGALAKRGGIGIGVGMSLGFFILYWVGLIGGEKLADRGIVTAWQGMWAANILLAVIGIIFTIRVLRETPFFSFSILNFFKKK